MKSRPLNGKKTPLVDIDQKVHVARPVATVTIEPMGRRSTPPRDYLLKVVLELVHADDKLGDKNLVTATLRRALAAEGAAGERAQVRELTASSRGKAGVLTTVVVGVEGTVTLADRPADALIEQLSTTLLGGGYRVAIRERRECEQAGCSTDSVVDWRTRDGVPMGWFSLSICGKHNYRQCATCKSVYLLTCINAAGQAPSVHCQVCGTVLIEWGTSKIWDAELVTRGPSAG